MNYDPESLARLKHLYDLGDHIFDITDDHEKRIKGLEEASSSSILYATKAYWDRQLTFVPPRGAIIIYSDYARVEVDGSGKNVPNFKVGDGNAYVVDLPFLHCDLQSALEAHIQNANAHLSDEDRQKLGSSVKASVAVQNGSNDYTLVFSTD